MAYTIPWRKMPPLSALRAFSAFAETGGVAQAGAALNVSHAAISQQLRALEAHLGAALLDRTGRAMVLTTQGARLAQALRSGFAEMARAVEELTGQGDARALHITTTPGFAASWLLPRLADFRGRHPQIDLVIDPTPDLRTIGPNDADIAIRYGNGAWPGLTAQLLVSSPVVVVAAPRLIAGRPMTGVSDLADLPWLQELGTTEATGFLEKHGVARAAGVGLTSLPGNLMLDAARDGQGVAVIARAFVAPDIAAGRLQVLFEDAEREGYYLVTGAAPLRPAARAFATWAMRQQSAPVSFAT